MSPILVRPVREQLEHDRVIRLLQAKYKRKFEVGINPGPSLLAPIGSGEAALYPDLVLQSQDKARRLMGVVEVETVESVNHLEAMSQWVRFGRLRAELHLYVPASVIDATRRLCGDFSVPVAEIWTYHVVGEEIRFTLVQKNAVAHAPEPRAAVAKAPAGEKSPGRPKVASARPTPAKPAVKKAAPKAKPAAKVKPAVKKTAKSVAKAPVRKSAPPKKPVAVKKPVATKKAAPSKKGAVKRPAPKPVKKTAARKR